MISQPTNTEIAMTLEQIAQLLEDREDNPFRVRAYRNAADTIRTTEESVADLAAGEDQSALMSLPGIGEGLADLIADYVKTGESDLLRQLKEQAGPESGLLRVPGIGEALARRIVEQLDIHTLEELEVAAHDGRLDSVEGFGADRVKAVRASLAGMLSDSAQRRARQRTKPERETPDEPPLSLLLEIDTEYRRRAAAGELQKIAPKRFNPEGKAWLPVLHTARDGWSFTALFSNTARAHEAGKTDDWVVLYFERDGGEERQRTVVTETQGSLAGRRVVRGLETETRRFYSDSQ
jgi:hypothetical protein